MYIVTRICKTKKDYPSCDFNYLEKSANINVWSKEKKADKRK